jgi:hypothetical protein
MPIVKGKIPPAGRGTAKQIALMIPPNVLARADKVIKQLVAFRRIELISPSTRSVFQFNPADFVPLR